MSDHFIVPYRKCMIGLDKKESYPSSSSFKRMERQWNMRTECKYIQSLMLGKWYEILISDDRGSYPEENIPYDNFCCQLLNIDSKAILAVQIYSALVVLTSYTWCFPLPISTSQANLQQRIDVCLYIFLVNLLNVINELWSSINFDFKLQ